MFSNKSTKASKRQRVSGSSDIKAFLGPGSEFEGRISFIENMRIDGTFKGEIVSQDLLVVGESGNLKAEAAVGSMIINGTFDGTIKAQEKVELRAPAKVTGVITCPCISIEDGVTYNGSIHMTTKRDNPKE